MRFSFDEFVLDSAARELRRSDVAVHLSPKAFDLLLALVERRPAAVSKADLHTLLWPDTFVTDTSLATLIGEVRNALDDDARRPRYVRTVHAFGYAFCGQAVASEHLPGLPAVARQEGTVRAKAGIISARCWVQWEGRRFPLSEGENLIGRAAESAVAVDLPEVSRRHARIRVSPARAMLEDLGSRNGTFVRGERIAEPRTLSDGDEIKVGPVGLTFHVALDGATTKAILRNS